MLMSPDYFAVEHLGDPPMDVPAIAPKYSIALDPDIDGEWFVTADVDGDGEVEIISARNYIDDSTPPNVTSVCVRKLDGSILWEWGDRAAGGWRLGYDVACQVHDWDGDGKLEVLLTARGALVELEGATGRERRRITIPDSATDCLTFVDLDGSGFKRQVLVKDRYFNIWAMDYSGAVRWHRQFPWGYRTAHQPYAMDIDGDGRDEIMIGYGLVNADGETVWSYNPTWYREILGHLDCCRVFRKGATPADWRIAVTVCGHRGIIMLDGEGNKLWQHADRHFESIDIAHLLPGSDKTQIVVDLAQEATDEHVLWILDEDGVLMGQMLFENPRLHTTLDVMGLGCDQIVQAHARGVYNHRGECIARLDLPAPGGTIQRGDMTGSGKIGYAIPTIKSAGAPPMIHLFEVDNEFAKSADTLGCGVNYTLY
jgi:hypothetical protein